jgi:hypothetical protein
MVKKALVIGGGPSITENMIDYDRLGKFPGVVLCTDNSVARMLEAGYRDFYAVTLEDAPSLKEYYEPQVVKDHGKEILGGWVADRVHRQVKHAMTEAGISTETAGECRGFITSNVGLYCWLIAVNHYRCDEVYMIGMDHSYGKDQKPNCDKNSSNPDERELYLHVFQELVNPYNKEQIILHPANQLWHEEFVWFAKKAKGCKTINCTGRGALFDPVFEWKPISQLETW